MRVSKKAKRIHELENENTKLREAIANLNRALGIARQRNEVLQKQVEVLKAKKSLPPKAKRMR